MPENVLLETPVCPRCKAKLDTAALASGQRFLCSECELVLRAEKGRDGTVYRLIEYITSVCTNCLMRQHVRQIYLSRRVLCNHCNQPFRADPAAKLEVPEPASQFKSATIANRTPIVLTELAPDAGRSNVAGPEEVEIKKLLDVIASYEKHTAALEARLQIMERELDQLRAAKDILPVQAAQIEQLETSLQIERKASAATLEELLSVRRDRERLRDDLDRLKTKYINQAASLAQASKELESLRHATGVESESSNA
jgi:hypothetical protein